MKKEYESPKAEKMDFNYSDTVVASTCHNETHYTDTNAEGEYCTSRETYHVIADK